jgi:hypothetical protein
MGPVDLRHGLRAKVEVGGAASDETNLVVWALIPGWAYRMTQPKAGPSLLRSWRTGRVYWIGSVLRGKRTTGTGSAFFRKFYEAIAMLKAGVAAAL